MVEIGIFDWVIWLTYLTIAFLLLFIYRRTKEDEKIYKFFLPGFIIKILSGVVFVMIYKFYYGFGDTFLYHNGAKTLANLFFEDPGAYFQLLLSESGNLPPRLQEYSYLIPYSRTAEEWFMVKLLSPLNLISFNSYLVVTLFMSVLSFIGSWKLFKVFNDILKGKEMWSFIGAFLLPSVLFWGSGILKDTVALAALNILIYSVYFMIKKNKYPFWRVVGALFMIILIFKIKSYIILAFLPCLIIIAYLVFQSRAKVKILKYTMSPILIGTFGFLIYFSFNQLSSLSNKYELEQIEKKTKGFHSWHTTTAGSAYNFGEIEYTFTGVLQKVPPSLIVTFFRPYPWEVRNAVMLISALESLLILYLFLHAMLKWNIKLFAGFRRNPFIFGILFFVLFFGFVVGFTSYNFGALMRYKIPISSLSFFLLIYMIFTPKRVEERSEQVISEPALEV